MSFQGCGNNTAFNGSNSTNGSVSGLCGDVSTGYNDVAGENGELGEAIIKLAQEPPLIESNFSMAIIYIILMVSALTIGTIGNTLILIASACFKGLRKSGFIFIINLAVADLCVAGIADPMCVIAVLKGEAWFNDKPWLCETVAAMCLTACFCAFLSLTMASLNRYVFVCHNMFYNRFFTKKMCMVMCVTAWVMAFLFEFPNFLGWGDHSFDQKSHQCIWDRTASLSYTIVVSVGLIGTPLVTMAMCYILIFKKIYDTKATLYKIETDDPERQKKIWTETIRSSRMLFIIFVIFVMFWTPYAVVIAADVKDTMPTSLHLFVTMLAHLHSSVNFCVYIACNPKFRACVLRLICCGNCADGSTFLSETRSTSSAPKVSSVTGTTSSYATATEKSGVVSKNSVES